MKDTLKFLVGLVGIFVVALGIPAACFFIGIAIYRSDYMQYGELTGHPVFYSAGTGCLVRRGNEWVNYNVVVGQKQEITVRMSEAQP